MATVVVFSCGLIYIYILHCETSFICYFRAVTTGKLPQSAQNAIGNFKIGYLPVDIILCLSSILLNKNTTFKFRTYSISTVSPEIVCPSLSNTSFRRLSNKSFRF